MNDFIGVYENAFSPEYCKLVINHFDTMQKNGFTLNRMQTGKQTIEVDDEHLACHSHEQINFTPANLMTTFNGVFWTKYKEYSNKYSILTTVGGHNNYCFKVQKTDIGGGYHTWHCEAHSRESCHRVLAWMVYLNDVAEGGETEFLYQHKRINAKQGTLVIFPSAFTHAHRGNPPLSNAKYVITGWVEF
jgi:hypothetical protein